MTNPAGTPIWYELMSDDPDAAERFYGAAAGWSVERLDRDYRVFSTAAGIAVGGVMTPPEAVPGGALWAVYFGVDDVDAAAAKVISLGGRVHVVPSAIPGMGRFAFVADPQGATFYLRRDATDADSSAFAPDTTGHCSWNELVTSDQVAALDFYAALFGWEKIGAMPRGELGDYTFIAAAGTRIGAMMDAPDRSAPPLWNFAFNVADIDAAAEAVTAQGGVLRRGPMELPEDSGWLIQVTDPQGAQVMFTGPRLATAA